MKRVLITGMSGTGKTTVTRELVLRGYRAVDLDTPEWSHWVDIDPSDIPTPAEGKDWIWQEDRVRALLSESLDQPLFISGCAENMHRLYPLIDLVILLSAPTEMLMERLAARSADGFGHSAQEREKVAHFISVIEPLLRKAADHEIVTRGSVEATVDELLRLTAQ